MPRPKTMLRPGPTLCVCLRGQVDMDMIGHVTRVILCENSQGKCHAPRASKTRRTDFARAFAVEMDIERHNGHFMQKKMRRPKIMLRPGPTLCVCLCGRHGHGHVTRVILCENSEGKCRAPRASKSRRTDFARAWEVEMDMGMSQEQFYVRIYSKKYGNQMEHPDQHRP